MLPDDWKPSDAIHRVLRNATENDPAGPEEFSSATGMRGSSLHQTLTRLVRMGWAIRIRKGVYVKGPNLPEKK